VIVDGEPKAPQVSADENVAVVRTSVEEASPDSVAEAVSE
jgi:hypothetical protein